MTDASHHIDETADQTPPPTTIHITDDELREVGWLVDTRQLDKKGWEDIYLAVLSATGERTKAAKEAGVAERRVQQRIKDDAIFAELYQQALDQRGAELDDLAFRFARDGFPRTYKNKRGEVITDMQIDPRFLEFYLKSKVPGYKDTDRDTLGKALEGGIHVNFQIGERQGPPAETTADLELSPGDVTEDDSTA